MFTLAHLSDPHLPMPEARPGQLLNKRATGYFNWWRNRHRIHVPQALAGIVALLGSHLYSLFVNFLASGEYRRVDAGTMVERPYRRIAVIQVFAIACGALLQYFDSPVLAVAVFVVVKIVIDWHLHDRERVVLGESSIRGI